MHLFGAGRIDDGWHDGAFIERSFDAAHGRGGAGARFEVPGAVDELAADDDVEGNVIGDAGIFAVELLDGQIARDDGAQIERRGESARRGLCAVSGGERANVNRNQGARDHRMSWGA